MAENHAVERARMCREVEAMVRHTAGETGRRRLTAEVMAALEAVPRHRFVPADRQAWAYDNAPLPIGHGQTISQPYIVALMTDLLEPRPEHRVLEVGTGSGYQCAVLARLVRQVYSIERVAALGGTCRAILEALGIDNVALTVGDGYAGWPEHAPYDGVMVTAAAPHVPPPLVTQLAPGGRLVIPVGPPFGPQDLRLLRKTGRGTVVSRSILPVAFVPLTGDHPSPPP